jgi:hypothetical protein
MKPSYFVCIAAANTFGTGADRQYVGRNQLDESTLDRFRIGQIELDDARTSKPPSAPMRHFGCRDQGARSDDESALTPTHSAQEVSAMFGRFFSALRLLSVNAGALAASFAEANQRFRSNLALDATEEPLVALPGPVTEDNDRDGARRNNRDRSRAGL